MQVRRPVLVAPWGTREVVLVVLWLGLSVAAYLPPGRPRHKDAPLHYTVVLRLIAAWLYERSGSILPPSPRAPRGTRRRL